MQSLSWYVRRIKGMSPAEIAWRVGGLSRDWVDRGRFTLGIYPKISHSDAGESVNEINRGFSLHRNSTDFAHADNDGTWLSELLGNATAITDGKLTYFNRSKEFLGDPIDWHKDHNANISSSRSLIQRVDYRDFSVNGDCKQVWEPNRHHQFVVLARAYVASGDERFAKAVVDQMCAWIQQNPFGYGMNWRSPLELGVRLINWVFAIELIRDSGMLKGQQWREIYSVIYLHCWEISRKLSQGSSANNHLVGELAGLYVAASYFPDMPKAGKWKEECKAALEKEIDLQSYSDGCTREQALGYQFFVVQFYLISGLVGRWTGNEFSTDYWTRLCKMFEFVAQMAEFGPLPLFGDQDDGYVLDLGDSARDVAALMNVGQHVFSLSTNATSLAKPSQSAYWLFDTQQLLPEATTTVDSTNRSVAFTESGYYMLQSEQPDHRVSVVFDCAELGYGSIAAHGHADALSFTLRVDNEYVLVDPGTFDYFTYPVFRNYFRSTAAHNTVRIDGQDQSEMHGPFMWGKQATSRCIDFTVDEKYAEVTGEQDGYRRLDDPVLHRRSVRLEYDSSSCLIEDHIFAKDQHQVDVFFHFGPSCKLIDSTDGTIRFDVSGRFVCELELDDSLTATIYNGSEDPVAGWYSPGYHQKTPIATVVGSSSIRGDCVLRHRLKMIWEH